MTGGLERYLLDEAIGVGSFATVHRGHDRLLDDTVVVKILAENHSLNPEIRERFIAEGRSLRRVASRHVVTVYDIGESDRQQPYLVLEHADRGTLAQRVESLRSQGWRPRPEDVLAVVRPLVAALEAVHRAQLVHRDLSPGNLLLTRETNAEDLSARQAPHGHVVHTGERLLVSDLGMCKDLAVNSGLTVSGGTAGFRPPEQTGPSVVDTRADIWAASALLAWLTEGSHLPQQLTRVLHRGMKTQPRQRQQTITQWGAEVETALSSPPSQTVPEGETPRETPSESAQPAAVPDHPSRPSARRWRLLWMTGLVMGLVAALFGLWGGYQLGSSDPPVSAVQNASIEVIGPEQIAVGETVTLNAEVTGLDSWVWTLPTGRQVADEMEVSLTATSAGASQVLLRALAPDGTELATRHTVRVVESE